MPPDDISNHAPPKNPPFDPDSPFLRQEALCAGLHRHEIDGPDFQRLFGSVRVAAHVDLDARTRARAALLIVPGAVVSHHTAAAIYRAVVPESDVVHVTVTSAGARRRRAGIRCHVSTVPTLDVGDLTLTTPERTFIDLAAELDLVDLVILGDSLVERGLTTPDLLVQATVKAAGRHAASARAGAALVREGAESPMETRLRLLLVMAGFPEPRIQMSVTDESGRPRYRFDLCYPELRVAIEYDGRHHAEDPGQWSYDIGRREWLDGRGWRLIVIRSVDVFGDPWATAHRIAGILAQQGYERTLPASPPVAFSRHFPAQPWRKAS